MALMDKYGADAMRYNLLTLITTNQDVKFDANLDKKTRELIDSPRTEQARSFVTKIWNASRFVQMNLDGYTPGAPKAETAEDAWMLSRLARAVEAATRQLEGYEFGDYARDLQSFFWGEVCDWYIELCKGRLLHGTPEERLQVQRNLVYVLDVSMRLLHPVMPFVTERVGRAARERPRRPLRAVPHDRCVARARRPRCLCERQGRARLRARTPCGLCRALDARPLPLVPQG